MPRRLIPIVMLFILLAMAGESCAAPIRVTATIFPLADLVRQLGGNRVEVVTLLPANASVHTFEPTPTLMRQMSGTRLLVKVGAGLDSWADRLLAGSPVKPASIAITDGLTLLPVKQEELLSGRHDHHHEGDDPHVWLDPIMVRDSVVPRLVATLAGISPGDAKIFQANGDRLRNELTQLDSEYRRAVGRLATRDFIALHSAWSYLAKRYGLKQVAAVETFPGKEPSARYMAALISLARRQGVKTVFAEPQLSDKAARTIADEIGGRVLLLDPVGGEKIAGRTSYQSLMRYNLSVIAAGMK